MYAFKSCIGINASAIRAFAFPIKGISRMKQARNTKSTSKSSAVSTREKILNVAEELFAEHGINGVSMRQLTAAANVNLAAINYYFGTKETLLAEIFARRAGPIIEQRGKMLEECEEKPGKPPILEQVIEAFVRPALDSTQGPDGLKFMQLRARLSYERDQTIRDLFPRFFDPMTHRFIEFFQKILPHLSKAEVCWRFHFLLGAMIYSMANPGRIQTLSGGICNPGDWEENLKEMVPFLAAGFRAPPVIAAAPQSKSRKTKQG